jgi:hypothetical protein
MLENYTEFNILLNKMGTIAQETKNKEQYEIFSKYFRLALKRMKTLFPHNNSAGQYVGDHICYQKFLTTGTILQDRLHKKLMK